jgi:hypothetical protein
MSNHHQPFQTVTHYQVSFTIPDDKETTVIIKTSSLGVVFATSTQDALSQTKAENEYSHQSLASYIMGFVRDNLWDVDVDNTKLTYTDEPTIKLMTQEELKDFQRDIISANTQSCRT